MGTPISAVAWEPSDQLKPIIQKEEEETVTMVSVSAIVENTSKKPSLFTQTKPKLSPAKNKHKPTS